MSIEELINGALSAVLANTHAVELPPDPTFPAIVFQVDTEPEPGWSQGGGYDQHTVSVVTLCPTKSEQIALRSQIEAALENLDGYMGAEERGDAEYEPDPAVYAYFQNFRIRLRIENHA